MPKLIDAPSTVRTDLWAWCHDQNALRITERMGRWYYVAEKDDNRFIDSLDGTDGENVRRELDGTLPNFQGWPAERMAGYRRWLRSVAIKGLRPGTLDTPSQRDGDELQDDCVKGEAA